MLTAISLTFLATTIEGLNVILDTVAPRRSTSGGPA